MKSAHTEQTWINLDGLKVVEARGEMTRLSYEGLTVEVVDSKILDAIKLADQPRLGLSVDEEKGGEPSQSCPRCPDISLDCPNE